MLKNESINKIEELVIKLSIEKDKWMSLAIAVDLSDEIMKLILPNNLEWYKELSRDTQNTGNLPKPLPIDIFKTHKQITWFHEHPESASARIALRHFYHEDSAIESNFFWFSESSNKQKISVASQFTTNWEDNDLTRKPEYKVGVDFFLTADTNSLLMVISKNHRLRVLEFSGSLSNTQKQILVNNLAGVASFAEAKVNSLQTIETQKVIHNALWNALQLKEVNKQFYSVIAQQFHILVSHMVERNRDVDNSKQFASRLLGRLLFTWFLRKMEVIDENYGYFDVGNENSTDYYDTKLKKLFFNTLNMPISKRVHNDKNTPYLNGGLFEIKENDYYLEKIMFPPNYFEDLFSHFNEFNFTTDESSSDFELIAVDPEMLGQVFESLLATQFSSDGTNERNNTGSFYTPREVVDYMCKESLRQYLYNKVDNEQFNQGIDNLLDWSDSRFMNSKSTSLVDLWGVNSKSVITKIKKALKELKVIDPACGSGAFPMGMLQLLLKVYQRIEKNFDSYQLKLDIIENVIYGVDIQPMAVEISRLRAWLSVIVDEKDIKAIHPLPNLDFKFIAANTLKKLAVGNNSLFSDPNLDINLEKLREKYFNAKKPENKLKYQEEYLKLTSSINLFDDERSTQLKTFDPFKNRYSADFFDCHYMFGVSEGFDIVIGNPPYGATFSRSEKVYLSKLYPSVPDFESSNYFISCTKDFLKKEGFLTYIIPNTVLTNVYAKNYRRELLEAWTIHSIFDMTNSRVFETAVVRNCIISLFNSVNENYSTYLIQEKTEIDDFELDFNKFYDKEFLEDNIESWLNLFYMDIDEQKLISKIRKNSTRLDAFADVSQGVIPYDVHAGTPKEIKDAKAYNSNTQKDSTYKKMLKGADVRRYNLKWNGKNWISYGPWLANPREPKFFTDPRLLFREITNPYIYCTYTEDEYYNNPSIINATSFNNVNPKYILGIVNSKLLNYFHRKNSPKANKGDFPKMLIKDVREMPIKIGTDEQVSEIISLVENLLMGNINVLSLNNAIDNIVYEIYQIDEKEKSIVEKLIPENWVS